MAPKSDVWKYLIKINKAHVKRNFKLKHTSMKKSDMF